MILFETQAALRSWSLLREARTSRPFRLRIAIKTELPLVGGVMLIGDQRKYLQVMMAVRTEVDPGHVQKPTDRLAHTACEGISSPSAAVSQTLSASRTCTSRACRRAGLLDPTARPVLKKEVREAVQHAIDVANAHAVSRAQRRCRSSWWWRATSRSSGARWARRWSCVGRLSSRAYKELIEYVYAEPPPAGATSADWRSSTHQIWQINSISQCSPHNLLAIVSKDLHSLITPSI